MSSSASPAASKGGASAASSGKSSRIPNVVSIAGVDPSGGAGVFADLKAFSALGAYGCGVIAALTAQNTQAVTGVHVPPTDFLRLQIDTLFADVSIHATKIGMLGSAEVTTTVAERLAHWQAANVVLDPVMVAKSGDSLLAKSAISAMREALFPQAFLITPNLPEAGVLLEQRAPETVREMYRAAERLRRVDEFTLSERQHFTADKSCKSCPGQEPEQEAEHDDAAAESLVGELTDNCCEEEQGDNDEEVGEAHEH